VISGIRRGVREVFALRGCYATLLLTYLVTFFSGQPTGPQGSSCQRPT